MAHIGIPKQRLPNFERPLKLLWQNFRSSSSSLCSGDSRVMLVLYKGYFRVILGLCRGYVRDIYIYIHICWGYIGVMLGVYWGCVGVILGLEKDPPQPGLFGYSTCETYQLSTANLPQNRPQQNATLVLRGFIGRCCAFVMVSFVVCLRLANRQHEPDHKKHTWGFFEGGVRFQF